MDREYLVPRDLLLYLQGKAKKFSKNMLFIAGFSRVMSKYFIPGDRGEIAAH